jgi:methylthioribulose-1-phosphate dehydratase
MEKNPFPYPSSLQSVYLRELVRCAKSCYDRGWSFGTAGNFSLRGDYGIAWQSPSGLNKGDLNPDLFIPVEIATGEVLTPLKTLKPSLEMPVHIGIYRTVPGALSVVHTHPPEIVKRSRYGKDLVFHGQEMQKALGCKDHLETLRVPVAVNPTPEQMPAFMNDTASYVVPGVPMVVLAGHGVYAWGKSPMEALCFVEALEFLCQTSPEQP